MTSLSIDLPDEFLANIGVKKVESLAREALLVRLYDLGEVSSGQAARLLGISRREFLDLLGKYNVSIFDESMNIEEELRHSRAAERG